MKRLPTDRKILRCIYETYAPSYPSDPGKPERAKDPWVPIVIADIAPKLGILPQMLFGRLYFHIAQKYSFTQSNGTVCHLFEMKVGADMHCINFPYLAAALAERDDEYRWRFWTLLAAAAAVMISLAALSLQLLRGMEVAPRKVATTIPLSQTIPQASTKSQ